MHCPQSWSMQALPVADQGAGLSRLRPESAAMAAWLGLQPAYSRDYKTVHRPRSRNPWPRAIQRQLAPYPARPVTSWLSSAPLRAGPIAQGGHIGIQREQRGHLSERSSGVLSHVQFPLVLESGCNVRVLSDSRKPGGANSDIQKIDVRINPNAALIKRNQQIHLAKTTSKNRNLLIKKNFYPLVLQQLRHQLHDDPLYFARAKRMRSSQCR